MKKFFLFSIIFFWIFFSSESIFAQLNYSQSYIDVPNTREDYVYIEDLRKKWLIDAKENFYPDEWITRAEFTKILTLWTVWVNYQKIDWVNSFSDISKRDWFWPYVQSARLYHFVWWYPDWTFKPWNSINRAEALKIILKATWLNLSYENSHYRDFSNSEWFSKYANSAYEYWIFEWEIWKNWLPQWLFWPDKKVTRWEMATWFSKALSLSEYYK